MGFKGFREGRMGGIVKQLPLAQVISGHDLRLPLRGESASPSSSAPPPRSCTLSLSNK